MGVEWWEAELWGSRVVTKQNRGSIIVVLESSMSRIVVQNWEAGAVTAFSRWSKTGNLNIQYYKLDFTRTGRLEQKRHVGGWKRSLSIESARNVTCIESAEAGHQERQAETSRT